MDLLLAQHGQELRFRGDIIRGVVSYNDETTALMRGEIDFTARNGSTIYLARDAVANPPMKGESLQGEDDRYHRIVEALHDGQWHRLVCEVSDGP